MYFAGSNCLTNVDNCIGMCTGSYVDPNTKRCKEMLNDYQCICKAGYTGKTCNVSFYEVAYIYFFLFQHEKKRCGTIANDTTIQQSVNNVNLINYRQSWCLLH